MQDRRLIAASGIHRATETAPADDLRGLSVDSGDADRHPVVCQVQSPLFILQPRLQPALRRLARRVSRRSLPPRPARLPDELLISVSVHSSQEDRPHVTTLLPRAGAGRRLSGGAARCRVRTDAASGHRRAAGVPNSNIFDPNRAPIIVIRIGAHRLVLVPRNVGGAQVHPSERDQQQDRPGLLAPDYVYRRGRGVQRQRRVPRSRLARAVYLLS